MKIIMSSPDVALHNGALNPDVVRSLTDIAQANYPVVLVSNRPKPYWFDNVFGGTQVRFLKHIGRQNGVIVSQIAASMQLNSFDVIVLASKDEDIAMAKNGNAVLIGARWSSSARVTALGIQVTDPIEFQNVLHLIDTWHGGWWFTSSPANYRVKALADLSSYGQSNTQQIFSTKLVDTVKNGGTRLTALLAVTARSLIKDNIGNSPNLLWGVYPSSNSSNNDSEVLSDFTHRLRTTVSTVRFAKREEPLFIRHTPSIKRSLNKTTNRVDPCNQIETIHINPYYEDGGRLRGRNILVIDDCTTYGVSFGVAAAFLNKAGAASVIGIALGKFGGQLHNYQINIEADPFLPVSKGSYSFLAPSAFLGTNDHNPQQTLRSLIP